MLHDFELCGFVLKAGADVEEMRLVFAGQELEDDRTVGDYEIHNGNIYNFIVC